MIRHTPPSRSALQRALHGEIVEWTIDTQLTAALVDLLRAANWQRGGGQGARPQPIPRPEDIQEQRLTSEDLRRNQLQSGVIGTPIPVDEMKAWLEAINGPR